MISTIPQVKNGSIFSGNYSVQDNKNDAAALLRKASSRLNHHRLRKIPRSLSSAKN
jgi:hypothetical protein